MIRDLIFFGSGMLCGAALALISVFEARFCAWRLMRRIMTGMWWWCPSCGWKEKSDGMRRLNCPVCNCRLPQTAEEWKAAR